MPRFSWTSAVGRGVGLWLPMLVYLAGVLWCLPHFPSYFFCDEAVSANWAEYLLRHHGRGADGALLPTFFPNGGKYNLGTSVYLAVPMVWAWGKSVVAVRALTAVLTALAAAALAWAVGRALSLPTGWLVPLWLVATPTWFLHARTGFEAPMAVAFFMFFLAFGLVFLAGAARALAPALLAAALSFYAYAPARLVVPLTAVALALAWLASPTKTRANAMAVGFLLFVSLLPYLRFVSTFPQEQGRQLAVLGSFWAQERPLGVALSQALASYLAAWSPRFWLDPSHHLARHAVPGYGQLQGSLVPLVLLGGVVALWRAWRGPQIAGYRFLLLSLLFAPAAALLLSPGVTRQLFLVPLLAVLAAVGGSALLGVRSSWVKRALTTLLAFGVVALAGRMAVRGMVEGPPLEQDYGFYGLQWGAQEVFSEVRFQLERNPGLAVALSPNWANGTEELASFFLPDMGRLRWTSYQEMASRRQDWLSHALVGLPAEEFERLRQDRKFTKPHLCTVLFFPNGKPAFFFFRVGYSGQAEALFAADAEARRRPVQAEVVVGEERWVVVHPQLDMGPITNAFDGNPNTLIRTLEANPLRVEVQFAQSRWLAGVRLRVGAAPTAVRVLSANGGWRQVAQASFSASRDTRTVEVLFAPLLVQRVAVEVANSGEGEPSHVHLWELQWLYTKERLP
ncbi:MAG: hypothetical protein N2447_04975 [Thermoanaerobaculum sp.]|nr:hypothetical protein [Thermoanaerobaculum sp.]